MSSQNLITRSLVVAVALAAAMSGIARGDDSSVGRFGSDGYAFFNTPISNKPASAFRQSNPNGLSQNQYQALSSEAPAWHPAPAVDRTRATLRQANWEGLSESQYQAMSSEAPAWHPQPSSTVPTRPSESVNSAAR